MSITFTTPPAFYITYQVGEVIGRDGYPAGCLSYFNDLEIAKANGNIIRKLIIAVYPYDGASFDSNGDRYKVIKLEDMKQSDIHLYMSQCFQEWESKIS